MKIGIDIGGSHIGVGLINKAGKIIEKEEKDLLASLQKENYTEILVSTIVSLITKILEKQNIDIKDEIIDNEDILKNLYEQLYLNKYSFYKKKIKKKKNFQKNHSIINS